ncbi:hypothetical protein NC653_010057 [Populus alba x Populus x berolinensis]|uniref:Phosphate transporter n=1 Tax=Populus alba x Populus x berolinensis TaxID=444605 RepID=A0AAD6QYV3_9ROSI|nr:hypothetical protein NC653_010057 [Populus alba x Populus x berolinensis]
MAVSLQFLKERQPDAGFLMWSLVVALITAAIWLAVATYWDLPVSSQQSNTECPVRNHPCHWRFWLHTLMEQEDAEKRILIFLPIDYGISTGLLCLLVIFQVVIVSLTIKKSNDIPNCKSNKKSRSIDHQCVEIQDKTSSIKDDEKNHEDIEEMLRDFMQTRVLETVYEEEERSWDSPLPDKIHGSQQQIQDFQQTQSVSQKSSTDQLTQFKQLLESTPNRLVQTRNFQRIEKRTLTSDASTYIRKICDFDYTPCRSSLFISYHSSISFFRMIAYLNNLVLMLKVIEYDRRTLVRHALAEKYDEMEDFYQLRTPPCFILQFSIEVAAIASPYAAILDVFDHRIKYLRDREDVECVHVEWWFRAISGLVAAMGFFLCGRRLTRCLGGKLTYMSNSRGLASQLSSVSEQ